MDKTLGERIKGGFSKTGEKISDGWITTKLNWFFVGEDLLKGSRIDVDTNIHRTPDIGQGNRGASEGS